MQARLIDVLNYASPNNTMKNLHEMMVLLHETLNELKQIPNVEAGIVIKEKTFIGRYHKTQRLFVFNTEDKGVTWCIPQDNYFKVTPKNNSKRNRPYIPFKQNAKDNHLAPVDGNFSLMFTRMLNDVGPNKKINEFFDIKGGFYQPELVNHHFCYDVMMSAIRAYDNNCTELTDTFPYMIGKSKAFLSYDIHRISDTGFDVRVTGAGMVFIMSWNGGAGFPCNSNMSEFLLNGQVKRN
ncbi:hypothetical protein [Aeromonas phage AerS_266]|nr:hypothetical protein [Aeromonas phage AerS_266]